MRFRPRRPVGSRLVRGVDVAPGGPAVAVRAAVGIGAISYWRQIAIGGSGGLRRGLCGRLRYRLAEVNGRGDGASDGGAQPACQRQATDETRGERHVLRDAAGDGRGERV